MLPAIAPDLARMDRSSLPLQQPQPQKTDKSLRASASAGGTVPSAKLTDAAHQFEASLMQELMEPMAHNSLGEDGDNDIDHDASSDALASFARESMAKSLAAAGGFGIARSILHALSMAGKAS